MYRPSRIIFLTVLLLLVLGGAHTYARDTPSSTGTSSTIDVKFPEPTSVMDVYLAVGKAFSLQVLFDPKLRDFDLSIVLEQVTATQALDLITKSAGHFATVLDERTVMIADETPQNRRNYETQLVRSFHLENIPLKDAMTALRSLLGVKHVAATEHLNSLVVRDSAAVVGIVERLLEVIDKPRGEIALAAEVLYLGGDAPPRPAESRLSAQEFADLRRSARLLTRQELDVLENDRGAWSLQDVLTMNRDGESFQVEVGFELGIRPQLHPASDELTLEVSLAVADVTEGAPPRGAREDAVSTQEIESGFRLRSGETFLLTGFAVKPHADGSGSWLASRFDLPAGEGEVVLALTPHIVRPPAFADSDLASICVGTESVTELCDRATELAVATSD